LNVAFIERTLNTEQLLIVKHDAVVRLVLQLVEELVLAHHVAHHGGLLLGPVGTYRTFKSWFFLTLVLLVPPKRPFRLVDASASHTHEGAT
jgi:hypothetical protein